MAKRRWAWQQDLFRSCLQVCRVTFLQYQRTNFSGYYVLWLCIKCILELHEFLKEMPRRLAQTPSFDAMRLIDHQRSAKAPYSFQQPDLHKGNCVHYHFAMHRQVRGCLLLIAVLTSSLFVIMTSHFPREPVGVENRHRTWHVLQLVSVIENTSYNENILNSQPHPSTKQKRRDSKPF